MFRHLDADKSTSLPADVTDDSCRLEFIEIVPLTTDTTQCDGGHWSDEHLTVVKQEPDDVCCTGTHHYVDL